tara:strand:- start:1008 stop:1439 length:432 start_codon:yes stop_codon:yes gene_type:complete
MNTINMNLINKFKEQLNTNKVYFRQLSYNDIPMKHEIGFTTDKDSGVYIDGIELFEHEKYYYLKTYTMWSGKVHLNSLSKINENGKITLFKINYFGLSSGECRKVAVDKDSYTHTNDYLNSINENLNNEDELRRVVIKEAQFK